MNNNIRSILKEAREFFHRRQIVIEFPEWGGVTIEIRPMARPSLSRKTKPKKGPKQ